MNNKQIATDTLQILKRGSYRLPDNSTIDIKTDINRCRDQTQCYSPEQLEDIRRQVTDKNRPSKKTMIKVHNETTLQGSRRLAKKNNYESIGVLNFASARNPGGGFKNGANAQEESLARSSALYYSLKECPDYYEYHRSQQSTLYSDRMIWSPHCPVFRTDDGTLLENPYSVDFITSPAPNAAAVRQNEPENISHIEPVLRQRSAKTLALAAYQGCDALVLGAWGCGVFKNDPQTVAGIFNEHLGTTDYFHNRFTKVLFSVLDNTKNKNTIRSFRKNLIH